MNNSLAIQQIIDFSEAAFVEIFQNNHCMVRGLNAANPSVNAHRYVSIDLHSEDIFIGMLLAFPIKLLKASYPIQENIDSLDINVLNDWYGELANRLLGSVKNKMVSTLQDLRMGLPVALESSSDITMAPSDASIETMYFEFEGEILSCSLMISLKKEIESFEQVETESMDGELEFF